MTICPKTVSKLSDTGPSFDREHGQAQYHYDICKLVLGDFNLRNIDSTLWPRVRGRSLQVHCQKFLRFTNDRRHTSLEIVNKSLSSVSGPQSDVLFGTLATEPARQLLKAWVS